MLLATDAPFKLFNLTLPEIAAALAVGAVIISIFGWAMRITLKPLDTAIKELSKDIKEFNKSRKENEAKLFKVSDDHTKEIAHLQGATNTLAVGQQSNTMRLDRLENRMDK